MNAKEYLLGGVAAVAMAGGLLGASAVIDSAKAQTTYGTIVSQSAQMANAATSLSGPFGGRTTCSTSQDTVANLTVTMTPSAGNYVYVTGVYIDVQPNATGASSTTVWSSTNLTGSPAWLTPTIATAAANPSSAVHVADTYPTALKSSVAGTAVTILPQATTASAFACPRVAWYQGP